MERFWSKVDKTPGQGPQGECWEWIQSTDRDGYGRFWLDDQHKGAHRVALELTLGRPLRDGYMACHTCDNPPCCNPAHLYEGTREDNTADKTARGRNSAGEDNGRAKLDWPKVREIRRRWSAGGVAKRALAREHEVDPSTIRDILDEKIWKEAA